MEKRSFSLIEIIIACMVLTLGVAAFSLASPHLFSHFHFKNSAKKFESSIKQAHILATHFQVPIDLTLVQTPSSVVMHIRPLGTLPIKWQRLLTHPEVLNGIESLEVDGKIRSSYTLSFEDGVCGTRAHHMKLIGKNESYLIFCPGYQTESEDGSRFPEEIL